MSKIYEALMRAESDRSVRNGQDPETFSQETVATAKVLASLAQNFAPPPGAAPRGGVAESPVPGRTGAIGPALVVDRRTVVVETKALVIAEQIPERVWNPQMKQLPALMERGSEVEQFRSLRSRMYEFRDLNSLKSLMISSGLPQEGKSFVAMNLAISFARHRASRVLLIDGDMRRSSLHKMLGCPNEPGLTEYLSGKNTLVEVMQRGRGEEGKPLDGGLASLTFISGGVDTEHAADLSGSARFQEMIKAVSPMFDWIVVDTPPVNLVADGVNLARACDGVLLIARGGVTKYEVAQRALAELKASKVLGFVLNAVSKPPVAGGYYGYDSYDA